VKFIYRFILIVLFGVTLSYANSDSLAGYNDGCSSSRGHYTRSAYKYVHSLSYRSHWKKARRVCRSVKPRHKYHRKHKYIHKCNTLTAWDQFKKGYDNGRQAAKRGHKIERISGCLEYRRGWVKGYHSCKCQ